LERLLDRADLRSPEGRARAASEAIAMISEHPNVLVRDQYLMEVADRCRLQPDRLREMARAGGATPGGGPRAGRGTGAKPETDLAPVAGSARSAEEPAPMAVGGPELEALRLAVHHPEQVADRLELVLFAHPLARVCFEVLSTATTLHEAIAAADPQAADLLQRLAVEDTDADVGDVMGRIVERAGQRAIRQLEAEMRQAPQADQASFAPTMTWLKLNLETLRREDPTARSAAWEAERRLVGWLVARDDAERTEAMR
jgi:DNA primase